MAARKPDQSARTVYQVEPSALALFRTFGTPQWPVALKRHLAKVDDLKREIERHRELARVPVALPDGQKVALSPGGQNPLIKAIIEESRPRFAPGGIVAYIGDAESKFAHLEAD